MNEDKEAERILRKWKRERAAEIVETPYKDAAYRVILRGARRIYKR
ncbi:MAG: hypothetical protein OCU22_09315 [Canidatus Methanoxibalbensis ujae]|nr:hypothetical protein [Candidatus Methanoxibalbensis ujae]